MKKHLSLIALVVVTALLGVLAWYLQTRAPDADPDNKIQVAIGEGIYADNCARCHGANLEGESNWMVRKPTGRLPAPPHDASGHTWHHPDEQLFGIVKNGLESYAPPGYVSDMPAFGPTLSDNEIWAVLAFIKSSWPQQIRDRQNAVTKNAGQ
jgi:mono/diheme cytochrome c family protein